MITETFNPETKIITAIFSGEITIDEFIQWESELIGNKYSVKILSILIDATKANYRFKVDDIILLKKILFENMQNYGFVAVAAVHSNSYETAVSQWFNAFVIKTGFAHATFSTVDNAVDWLTMLKNHLDN